MRLALGRSTGSPSLRGWSGGLWGRSSAGGYGSTLERFSFLSDTPKAFLLSGCSSRAAVGSITPQKYALVAPKLLKISVYS